MKVLIQTGSSGWVPVPPEKRFLINSGFPQEVSDGTVIMLKRLSRYREYGNPDGFNVSGKRRSGRLTGPLLAWMVALCCMLCGALLFAQGFIEPDSRLLYPHFLGFRPADGCAVEVNPPRFSWPYRPGLVGTADEPIKRFQFQVADNTGFGSPVVDVIVDYNFFNRLAPFAAGTWYWRVGYDHNADGTVDEWSEVRSFEVDGTAPEWDRSGHSHAYAALAGVSGANRPRFGPVNGDWAAFKTFLESTDRGQDWLAQLRTQANRIAGGGGFSGLSWYVNSSTHFPPTDEDGGPLDADGVVDGKVEFDTGSGTAVWRSNNYGRMAQQLVVVAFAHKITGDPVYAGAKDLLLRVAEFPHTENRRSLSWPEFHGATTKQTTAITEYLALLYDWYYDDLTPEERELLRGRVALRVQQVFLQGRSWRNEQNVYNNGVGIRCDSHHYQNFFWAMPGLLLLTGEDAVSDAMMGAEALLPLTIDFLTGVTAGGLYGPDDGAINEGVGYGGEKQGAMLRTALMAELLLDLEQKNNPFMTGYQRWYSHVMFAGFQRSPFGDQSSYNAWDQPLLNQQALALLTGNPQARTRWDAEAAIHGDHLEDHGFSRPWTMMLAYQHKQAHAEVTPEPESRNELFLESGWVMAGSDPPTEKALADSGPRMIFQSRPRGGLSHSYRAENTFSWHAFGEPLAGGGGSRRYPDPYSRHTMSHNSMLIDGQGQAWVNPGWPVKPYVGRILAYDEGVLPNGGSYVHWVGDASYAYRTLPGAGLRRWHRHIIFVDRSYFIVYDDLEMNEGADPARFSWLLQVDRPLPGDITVSGNEFAWEQNGVSARVAFSRAAPDLDIIHQSGTGAIADPEYVSGSGWAPDFEGNNVFDNPMTGEDLLPAVIAVFEGVAGSTRYYFSESEYAESQRTQNTLWVQNAELSTRWQLMTALLAWPVEDAAPAVHRLSNNRMQITYDETVRTISFDPTQPGDYTVDLNAYRVHAGEEIPEIPIVTVRGSSATVWENGGATPFFTIERSDNYSMPVEVSFSLTGTAISDVDYIVTAAGTVVIPAEESEAVIDLAILDNPILQTDRTIILTILPDSAYDVYQASATITILDDEALRPAVMNEAVEPGHTRSVEIILANPHASPRTFTLAGFEPVPFFEIDPASVTLQPGEGISIMLILDAAGLLPGHFADAITITDTNDGSTRQIPVLMTVADNLPPAAPGALSATRVSSTRIDLAWTDRSSNETGFRVERSLLPDADFNLVATLATDSVSYTDDGVVDADTTRYYYRVFAVNDHGESVSDVVAAGSEPVAPANVSATVLSSYDVEISWDYSGPETDRFFVERRFADTEDWFPVAVVPIGSSTYIDTVEEFGGYDYRVTAFDADFTGEASSSVPVVMEYIPMPPAAPANVEVVTLSATDLLITWETPATADYQYIERSVNGLDGPWSPLLYLPAHMSSYTDTGLDAETTYYYRIWASNDTGHGERTAAQGTTDSVGALTLSMPDTINEDAGSFLATVTRTGVSGNQVIRLTVSNDRLSVPRYISIPDGESTVEFTVTVNDDEIINLDDSATITAYAPTALMGESFSGAIDTDLTGQDTGWGWGGAWYHNNGSPVLKEPALSYSQNGMIGTPGTRAAQVIDPGSPIEGRRNFSAKISSNSVWASTLLSRNASHWGTQMILRENTGGGNWGRVIYKNDTDHWCLEVGLNNVTQLYDANPAPVMFFVVMQFDFMERKIRAWLNPDVSGSQPTNALGSAEMDMQEVLTGVSRLDIAGRNNADRFDEIRVATSFAGLYGGVSTARAIRILDDEVTPAFTPAEWWRIYYFETAALEGDTAWDADPDGDGVPNILEYALGGDPHKPHTVPRAEPGWIEIENETYWTFRIEHNPNAEDITFRVHTSVDLVEWLQGAEHIEVLDDEPGYIRVRSTVPLSLEAVRFMRLGVEP